MAVMFTQIAAVIRINFGGFHSLIISTSGESNNVLGSSGYFPRPLFSAFGKKSEEPPLAPDKAK